jgi:hypothetical protein
MILVYILVMECLDDTLIYDDVLGMECLDDILLMECLDDVTSHTFMF